MSDLIEVLAVLVTAIAAHELAHLGVARLVGHEVFEIQVGTGPSWTERIGSIDVRIGLVPLGGHVQTGAPPGDGFRWRSAAVAGAGVAANAALLVVGLGWQISAMVVFNGLAVVANLWPGRSRRLGHPSSDGRTLLDLARNDRDAIAEERSGWYCVEADRARRAGDVERAAELVAAGVADVGPTRALRAVDGVVAFEQRRFADVVDAYAHLIDDRRVTVAARAGFAADASWSASLSGDPDLLPFAEPWADFARRYRPDVPRRRIVHALALVDTGETDAALDVLDGVDDPSADAVRVLALVGAGDLETALTLFRTRVSGRIDADHPLLDRVLDALGPAAA